MADAQLVFHWAYQTQDVIDLSRWDRSDIDDLLLRWVPAKYAGGPDEAPTICDATASFLHFLADTGRLDGGWRRPRR